MVRRSWWKWWEPTALYRLRDQKKTRLYIGISNDVKRRFAQHADDKFWWKDVCHRHTRVRWYWSRGAAERAEERAIKSERPLYNVIHNEANPHRVIYRKRSGQRVHRRRLFWPRAWNVTALGVAALSAAQQGMWNPGPGWGLGLVLVTVLCGWAGWKRASR